MIKSLEVTNFRGFKTITLSNLPRFNVLLGPSGSGKTALLEALWIVGGVSPEIYFRLRALRGMAEDNLQIRGERTSYEALFNDIFFDPAKDSGAEIHIIDSLVGDRYLRISYESSQQLSIEGVARLPGGTTTVVRPLTFHWRIGDKDYSIPLKVEGGKIAVETPPESYPAILISSTVIISARENAERLSTLRINKQKQKLLQTVQRIFPEIEDLSSESVAGQQMIWAQLADKPKAIPLALVSSGINKFVSLMLAISQNTNGVLLVDEIENGFYFENYELIFRTLVEFADSYNVQLFVTTHSGELLKAIATVMEPREQDIAVLQTAAKAGQCTVRSIEGVSSMSAIQQNIEIRVSDSLHD